MKAIKRLPRLGDFQFDNVYQVDCLLAMRSFPDNYFDLVITDPPYGIGENNSKNLSRVGLASPIDYGNFEWDNQPASDEQILELIRISKNQIIFGGNYFNLYPSPCWVVWDKDNGNNDFADCELAWTSHSSAVRKFKYRWAGMLQENMKNKEIRIHPTQKPVQLYKWTLKNYAKPGMKIIDIHIGSGSSIIAFLDFGCDWIGFEIDPDYHKAATERIERHKQQLKLF